MGEDGVAVLLGGLLSVAASVLMVHGDEGSGGMVSGGSGPPASGEGRGGGGGSGSAAARVLRRWGAAAGRERLELGCCGWRPTPTFICNAIWWR